MRKWVGHLSVTNRSTHREITAMRLSLCCLAVWVVALATFQSQAADNPSGAASATGAPLKVLYITGGGYHKYDKLTPIIVDGIKKHANAEIDVKFGLDG